MHKQQIGEMDRDTKNLSQRRKEEVALIRQQKLRLEKENSDLKLSKEQEISALKAQKSSYEKENFFLAKEKTEEANRLKKEISALKNDFGLQISKKNTEIQEITSQAQNRETLHSKEVKMLHQSKREKLSLLQQQKSVLSKQTETLSTSLSKLTTQAETDATQSHHSLLTLQNSNTNLQAQIASFSIEISDFTSKITNLQQNLDFSHKLTQNLQSKIAQFEAETLKAQEDKILWEKERVNTGKKMALDLERLLGEKGSEVEKMRKILGQKEELWGMELEEKKILIADMKIKGEQKEGEFNLLRLEVAGFEGIRDRVGGMEAEGVRDRDLIKQLEKQRGILKGLLGDTNEKKKAMAQELATLKAQMGEDK